MSVPLTTSTLIIQDEYLVNSISKENCRHDRIKRNVSDMYASSMIIWLIIPFTFSANQTKVYKTSLRENITDRNLWCQPNRFGEWLIFQINFSYEYIVWYMSMCIWLLVILSDNIVAWLIHICWSNTLTLTQKHTHTHTVADWD